MLLEYVNELRQYDELLGEFDNEGDEAGNDPLKMMRMFAAEMEHVKALQGRVYTIETAYKEIETHNKEHMKIKDTLELQQSMVENLDRRNRESHIIITGIKEDQPLDGSETDEDKCKKILDTIGCAEHAGSVKSVLRLG